MRIFTDKLYQFYMIFSKSTTREEQYEELLYLNIIIYSLVLYLILLRAYIVYIG